MQMVQEHQIYNYILNTVEEINTKGNSIINKYEKMICYDLL